MTIDDDIRDALHRAAGDATPTDAVWRGIVAQAAGGDVVARPAAFDDRRQRLGRRGIALATAAAVVAAGLGVAALVGRSDGDGATRQVRVGVPSVTTGSADLIVQATSFTPQGARLPVPETVLDAVRQVAGVAEAHGVVRAITRLRPADEELGQGSMVPTVVVSWDAGDGFVLRDGRAPGDADEVALDQAAADATGVRIGDRVASEDAPRELRVVGLFSLGDVDPAGLPLLAGSLATARTILHDGAYTRLHVRVAKGADAIAVRDAVADVLPADFSAVGVSQLGTRQQLLDELAIQRAYFDLLSSDPARRAAATEGGVDTPESRASFEHYRESASQATLRVQRVTFLDADHAQVTYAIYWAAGPSPIITDPQAGTVVRLDGTWKIARSNLCDLANLVGNPCTPQPGEDPASLNHPPAGWAPPSTEPDAVAAFRTMADPAATVDARVSSVVDGEAQRDAVERALAFDARYRDHVRFWISGVRSRGADQVEVLYAVTATGEPPLETPYPLIGLAVRVDGRWRANGIYACGLRALVQQGC